MDNKTLPELPRYGIEFRATFGTIVGFTADQMREYAQAAIAGKLATARPHCAAQHASVGANDPQDCDWPVCGCDPHADKVIAALQESGRLIDAQPQAASSGLSDADLVDIYNGAELITNAWVDKQTERLRYKDKHTKFIKEVLRLAAAQQAKEGA